MFMIIFLMDAPHFSMVLTIKKFIVQLKFQFTTFVYFSKFMLKFNALII